MQNLVEHGVPIPMTARLGKGRPKDPAYLSVPHMNIGDSVFFKGRKVASVRSAFRLREEINRLMQEEGWTFSYDEAIKDGLHGCRAWRVS